MKYSYVEKEEVFLFGVVLKIWLFVGLIGIYLAYSGGMKLALVLAGSAIKLGFGTW